jgi:hypothetical protein
MKIRQSASRADGRIFISILCGFIYCQHYLSVNAAIQKKQMASQKIGASAAAER